MDLYNYIRERKRRFPFREGARPIPEITEETSKFAGGPARGQLTPFLRFGITTKCLKEKTFETALDFLMYFSIPENQNYFTKWSRTISSIRDTEIPQELANLSFEPQAIWYDGLTPEGRKLWLEGIRSMLEENGQVEDMIVVTARSIEADIAGLAQELKARL
jgi:hypothetical protein